MRKLQTGVKLIALVLAVGVLASSAQAGDLTRLDMRWVGAEPASYPVDLQVSAYKGDNEFKGTSTVTFDGSMMSNLVCDAVVCISSVAVEDGMLVVRYTVNGYKGDGTFDTETSIRVFYDAVQATWLRKYHTSCSRPIFAERPLAPETGSGIFYVEDGAGSCFYAEGECPAENKLFQVRGKFAVPCVDPGMITVNIYKSAENTPKGTSTAYFDGTTLTNIMCDAYACIRQGGVVNGMLLVGVDFFGYRDDGKFDTSTSFEIVVEGCGTFELEEYHTSCSRPIDLYVPFPMTGGGTLTWVNGCGGCLDLTVPTETSTWGTIKGLYR